MTSPLEKGNELEFAVRAIEMAILQSSPALREKTFKIESKKRITVDGVRHEIDVYVEVDLGKGYKATFIFECKNWKTAVGKNEIIIFSEKIAAAQAQKGFFVAKSFTRDAEAQAAKDTRLNLLNATEHDANEFPVPFNFHIVLLDKVNANLELFERGEYSSIRREAIHFENAWATLNGTDVDFEEYVRHWISDVRIESNRTFSTATLDEGVYDRDVEAERVFEEGELMQNDIDIARAKLALNLSVRVARPPVVSYFEVATRGRSLSLAPVTVGEGTIQFGFVVK